MARFRGKARFVSPPREAIHRTLGDRMPQHLMDGQAACLLDFVLGKYKDMEQRDPASVAVWEAVKAEAWGGLLQLLEAQAVLKALGKTALGDTKLLIFLLVNLGRKVGEPDRWQETLKVTGRLGVDVAITERREQIIAILSDPETRQLARTLQRALEAGTSVSGSVSVTGTLAAVTAP